MGYVMYALVDYIGNQILIKEGEKVKIPFLDKKVGIYIQPGEKPIQTAAYGTHPPRSIFP